jgi:hypothetical protein
MPRGRSTHTRHQPSSGEEEEKGERRMIDENELNNCECMQVATEELYTYKIHVFFTLQNTLINSPKS